MMPDKHLILLSVFIMQNLGYIIKVLPTIGIFDTLISDAFKLHERASLVK